MKSGTRPPPAGGRRTPPTPTVGGGGKLPTHNRPPQRRWLTTRREAAGWGDPVTPPQRGTPPGSLEKLFSPKVDRPRPPVAPDWAPAEAFGHAPGMGGVCGIKAHTATTERLRSVPPSSSQPRFRVSGSSPHRYQKRASPRRATVEATGGPTGTGPQPQFAHTARCNNKTPPLKAGWGESTGRAALAFFRSTTQHRGDEASPHPAHAATGVMPPLLSHLSLTASTPQKTAQGHTQQTLQRRPERDTGNEGNSHHSDSGTLGEQPGTLQEHHTKGHTDPAPTHRGWRATGQAGRTPPATGRDVTPARPQPRGASEGCPLRQKDQRSPAKATRQRAG